jgi:hypothetical protein
MSRIRQLTKAKITPRVGRAAKDSRDALSLGALGKSLIMESRNACRSLNSLDGRISFRRNPPFSGS